MRYYKYMLMKQHYILIEFLTMKSQAFLNKSTFYRFSIFLPSILIFMNITKISYCFANAPLTSLLLVLTLVLLFLPNLRERSVPLPPGPVGWPLIGNLPELFRNKPRFKWILKLMTEMNTDIACIRVGSVHIIPVKCPEIAREFLIKQDAKFASRPITMATEYTSRGFLSVVTSPLGDQWKKMRRVVANELLSSARFRWLHEKRVEEADNLVRYIYNQCMSSNHNKTNGSATVNVRVATRAYCGNFIRKLMFNKRYFGEGRNDGGPSVQEEEHVEALFTGLSCAYAFCVSDYLPCLRWLDVDGHEKIMRNATKIIDKYHNPIIENRIQQRQDANNGLCLKKESEDLLDILVSLEDDNGNPLLSSEEIKAVTAELVYAAVDNPSNAMEWALAEMLNQPKILQKAVEEIDNVVGKNRLVQESDISKLNYVKACAREAFRLHPIAPFNLPHVSTVDTTVAGYFIPKGSHVMLSRLGLGRNPKVWDEPLNFKPERHLNLSDGSSNVELHEPELRFLSFSTGRRGCMAVHLGSTMTTMLFARLLQGFDWTVPPGEASIDLSESSHDLLLAKPLHVHATPRLPPHIYPVN